MAWSSGDSLSPTNLNSKFGPMFNVKDLAYGALGSGTTNDGPAINVALSAASANGGVVYVPSGNYSLETSLLIPSGVALMMESNATMIRAFAGGASINATIRNMDQTNGNTNIAITGGTLAIASDSYSGKHLGLLRCDNTVLRDIKFSGVSKDWNTAIWGNDIVIDGLIMDSGDEVGEDGIHITGGERIAVSNCVIRSGDDALAINNDAGGSNISHVVVSNCYLESRAANPIRVTTTSSNSQIRYISIDNITGVVGGGQGIVLWGAPDNPLRDVTLSNVVMNAEANSGSAISIANAKRLDLNNVKIIGSNGRGFDISGSSQVGLRDCSSISLRGAGVQNFLIQNCSDILMEGCSAESATQAGIAVGGATSTVTNLTVRDCLVKNGASGQNAIHFTDAKQSLIEGCTVSRCTNGIVLGSSCQSNTVAFNDCFGVSGTPYTFPTDTATQAYGNRNHMAGTGLVQYHFDGVRVLAGAGTPESNSASSAGGLYLRTDGGPGTALYVKESGVGTTGWVAPLLSSVTQANFNDMSVSQLRVVLTASGMSLAISSGDSLYDLGSATSAVQPTS